MDIIHLPAEIILHILRFLSVNDLVKFARVSKFISDLSVESSLWKYHIFQRYNVQNRIYPEKSWYDNYTYIASLFKSEQLMILNKLKELSSDKYLFLTKLADYPNYYNKNTSSYVPLDTIVVYVSVGVQSSYTYTCLHIPVLPNKLMYITIENNHLIDGGFKSVSSELIQTLNVQGFFDTSNYHVQHYYALLNRHHLNAIRYVLT